MVRHATRIAALVIGAGAPFTPAAAKPPLQTAQPGAQIDPISIARVIKVRGQIVLDGDWMPYAGGAGTRGRHLNAPFFDSYGREPATAPGGPGLYCSVTCTTAWLDGHTDNGTRWYFGSAYHNPNTIEDMQDCACPPGSVISEIDLGWHWCPPQPSRCIIIFFPFEEVLDDSGALCTEPTAMTDTGGGGIALDFGQLPPGCPYYYYSRPFGLESIGSLSPATDDNGDPGGLADGSYQMVIASSLTPTGHTLATGPCQPMLWGTSRGYNGTVSTGPHPSSPWPGDCRPGLNNDISFDDDAPTDGVFANTGECYGYQYGICPDPLGKDNCFCFLRCPADYNNDGFVDGIDADTFFNDFESGTRCADLNGDCFVDGIDSDSFNNSFERGC